jgi:DNA repair protein RadA/Sms
VPKSNLPRQKIEGLQVIGVERIDQAMDKVRELM